MINYTDQHMLAQSQHKGVMYETPLIVGRYRKKSAIESIL